jgi:hypothetical protein
LDFATTLRRPFLTSWLMVGMWLDGRFGKVEKARNLPEQEPPARTISRFRGKHVFERENSKPRRLRCPHSLAAAAVSDDRDGQKSSSGERTSSAKWKIIQKSYSQLVATSVAAHRLVLRAVASAYLPASFPPNLADGRGNGRPHGQKERPPSEGRARRYSELSSTSVFSREESEYPIGMAKNKANFLFGGVRGPGQWT